MPLTAAAASVIGAGIAAGAAGGQMYANAKMNKKAIRYNERMYGLQREHALADWNMQNQYNSPAAQMQRFKEAGLNPNLIYGQQTDSPMVRTSSQPSWNPINTDIMPAGQALGNAFSNYLDLKAKEAGIKNMETANKVQEQEIILKAIQGANILAQTSATSFDLSQRQRLADTNAEMATQILQKSKVDTQLSLDKFEQEKMLNAQTLRQGVENILTARLNRAKTSAEIAHIKQALQNMKSDNLLKQYEIELNRKGVQKNDNILLRAGASVIDKLLGNPTNKPADFDSTGKPKSFGNKKWKY